MPLSRSGSQRVKRSSAIGTEGCSVAEAVVGRSVQSQLREVNPVDELWVGLHGVGSGIGLVTFAGRAALRRRPRGQRPLAAACRALVENALTCRPLPVLRTVAARSLAMHVILYHGGLSHHAIKSRDHKLILGPENN